jgi:branched-chain amino acid transport system substrate-binding protein
MINLYQQEELSMPIYMNRSLIMTIIFIVLIGSNVAMADVKVGFLGGFTGPLKSMTPAIYKAAKLAVKHVNDQGGVLDGEKIIMPNADTTCADTTAAAKAADSLVNTEKVLALVGALCSSATISVAENVAIPAGVTLVSPASTSPAITSLNDNDLVFRTTPSDLYQGSVMGRLLRSKGIKSIAITYVNNDYGKGFADALAAAFSAAGGKIAANEPHEEGKADYRARYVIWLLQGLKHWSSLPMPMAPARPLFVRHWKAVISINSWVVMGCSTAPLLARSAQINCGA